jgi:diaminohydroxyphosphoribosylaminopyrimidine deaminase / 5-amino-6-(5-phosphoribosylamino)uracil reductase
MSSNTDALFMQRALQLAQLGMGQVAPNPMVGCVIVHNNTIIGEGYHQKYGEAHAEVNAINSVLIKDLLAESTVYVSLEPCAHYGKTPPCAELLVKYKPKKVIVCNLDPNPLVAGKGMALLKENGIEVSNGLLEKEGLWLNRRFFTSFNQKRPYVILKWAQTAQGFVSNADKTPFAITGALANKLSHKWRSQEQAILIGAGTALTDNPSLTTRNWQGENPTRILLDPEISIEKSSHFFVLNARQLVLNTVKSSVEGQTKYIKLEDLSSVPNILEVLHQEGIQSVIVEGGTKTLQAFINTNSWDEARLFTSTNDMQAGYKGPIFDKTAVKKEFIGTDILETFFNT